MGYQSFLESKRQRHQHSGFSVSQFNPSQMDFQKFVTGRSLEAGRFAIFGDCGTGKTIMQLEWGQKVYEHTNKPVLIFAPLAVSLQTKREGAKFGYDVTVCREQAHVKPGLNITNYEIANHFDPREFSGIVLDESSILKSFTGATRNYLIEAWGSVPYRLCCTATPSPNDYMELGNHSEFLGAMGRTGMLATFFNHDGGETSKWRLKGHAVKAYWDWVSTWSIVFRKPSDIGFSDRGFDLQPIRRHIHIVNTTAQDGLLFPVAASSLTERRESRRISIKERVHVLADLVNGSKDQWLIWCDLNDESEAATDALLYAVEVKGADSDSHKEQALLGFAEGEVSRLVTKSKIAGFGMNFQRCSKMAHLGMSDSWESIYQDERRCWRYGQQNSVDSHFIVTDRDEKVIRNIDRKRAQADGMAGEMIAAMRRRNG